MTKTLFLSSKGSSFTSSLESGGFFGQVLAGYLTDLVLKRQLNRSTKKSSTQLTPSNARMPVAIAMMTGVGLCLHCFHFHVNESSSQLMITTIGFILGVCLYGPIAIFGVVATESAPQHLSGTSHAIVALAANGMITDFSHS
jgi:OPA family glycerol-6-phosphate transporter-like MFS transporter 4